jgi:hypothetical protein
MKIVLALKVLEKAIADVVECELSSLYSDSIYLGVCTTRYFPHHPNSAFLP